MRSLVSSVLQSTSEITEDPFKIADEALRRENQSLRDELAQMRLRLIDLERMADTDPLVPLNNRRAFMRELSRAQTVRARYDISSTMIYLDLDNFKSVNDQFGHAMGDQVLQLTAKALQAHIRDCDVAARIGGDEFAILLFKSDIDLAMVKAVAVSQAIRAACKDLLGGIIDLTVSWGVAECLSNLEPEEVLAKADTQMFSCKAHPAMKNLNYIAVDDML